MAENEKKTLKKTATRSKSVKASLKNIDVVNSASAPVVKRPKGLAPIGSLFGDAWQLLKQSLVMYLKMVGVGFVFFFGALAIGLSIIVSIFYLSRGNVEQLFVQSTPLQIVLLILLLLWTLALIGSVVIYQIISIIALLLYFSKPRHEWTLLSLFQQSRQYFWKFFFSGLLIGFAVIGGIVFLFVPGFVIGIFFSFVSMAIVLENRSVSDSLKRSYQIVRENFWAILGRIIVIELVAYVILQILDSLNEDSSIISLFSFIITIVLGLYVLAYTYLVYQQTSGVVPYDKSISIKWIWVLAVLGWICLLGLFVFAVFTGTAYAPAKNL